MFVGDGFLSRRNRVGFHNIYGEYAGLCSFIEVTLASPFGRCCAQRIKISMIAGGNHTEISGAPVGGGEGDVG